GGINFARPTVQKSYPLLSPTNYDLSQIGKKYESFKQIGSQYTFEVSFYFKGFSLSFQPTYQVSNFMYSYENMWITATQAGAYSLTEKYEQDQKVEHFLLPLILKYEFTGNKLRPYVQAGFNQAMLVNATKTVGISGVREDISGSSEFKHRPILIGAKDLFAKYYWGMIGGAGVNYNLGNVRLNLDIQYRYGMSNITSVANRYKNEQL